MKKLQIIILTLVSIFSVSCSEETRAFMEMNHNIKNGKYYTAEEFLEKAQYFLNGRDYYAAYMTTMHGAVPIYQKEKNIEGIRKANGLLCQIYSKKEPAEINRFYNPDLAKVACNKAGIKMNQE